MFQKLLHTQHETNKGDKQPCPQLETNPQSQQSRGFGPNLKLHSHRDWLFLPLLYTIYLKTLFILFSVSQLPNTDQAHEKYL